MKKFWKGAKKTFTKKEQKDVLKDSGNEKLSEAKNILDEAVKDYTEQIEGKDGKFNFRRERRGFGQKMQMKKDIDAARI